MKIETDYAQIRGGVRQGRTMGSPVALWIENRDFDKGLGPDKRPWRETMSLDSVDPPPAQVTRVRPGHADLTASLKYGYEDVRDSLERASARESAARVGAGAVARRLCEELGCEFHSHVVQIGCRRNRPRRRRSIGMWLRNLPSAARTPTWRRR